MKGLLIKDIHLLLRQKTTLLMMGVLLLFLSRNGLEFILGYFILVCFLLGDCTVNFDAADNGLAYLLTFPASRKTYVLEKYVLTLCPGAVATVLAIAIRVVVAMISQQPVELMEIMLSSLGVFFVSSLLVALFLPMELLGMEKARIIINISTSVFAVLFVILMDNEVVLQKLMAYAMRVVEEVSAGVVGAGSVAIWLVVMVSSILCSMFCMERREF